MTNEEIKSCIQTLRFLENTFLDDHGIFLNDKHPDNIEKIITFLHEPPCEDCISREETLNKINGLIAEYIPLMPIGWTLPLNIAKTINDLPSVTPQQTSWIPCSERLPAENGNYLVTVEANDGTASIKFQMVDHYGPAWLHEEKPRKVIAWMPLPEPYNAESEGSDTE